MGLNSDKTSEVFRINNNNTTTYFHKVTTRATHSWPMDIPPRRTISIRTFPRLLKQKFENWH